jgi:adenylate kinase family enzyme
MGLPGCGKGQLGRILQRNYNIKWVSVGRLIKRRFPFVGIDYESTSELASSLLKYEFLGNNTNLYIDGFPRTTSQIQECKNFASNHGFTLAFVHLNISAEESLNKCANRKLCSSCLKVWYFPDKKSCLYCSSPLLRRFDNSPEKTIAKISLQEIFLSSTSNLIALKIENLLSFDSPYNLDKVAEIIEFQFNLSKRCYLLDDDLSDISFSWF